MRKIICFNLLLLLISCKQDVKYDDVSFDLLSLSVEGKSILVHEKYYYTLPETDLHTIRINVTFPSFAHLTLSSLNHLKENENTYLIFLEEGENEITIKLERIENPTDYKEYKLKFNKTSYNKFESSLLSALCINEVNIL